MKVDRLERYAPTQYNPEKIGPNAAPATMPETGTTPAVRKITMVKQSTPSKMPAPKADKNPADPLRSAKSAIGQASKSVGLQMTAP